MAAEIAKQPERDAELMAACGREVAAAMQAALARLPRRKHRDFLVDTINFLRSGVAQFDEAERRAKAAVIAEPKPAEVVGKGSRSSDTIQ